MPLGELRVKLESRVYSTKSLLFPLIVGSSHESSAGLAGRFCFFFGRDFAHCGVSFPTLHHDLEQKSLFNIVYQVHSKYCK